MSIFKPMPRSWPPSIAEKRAARKENPLPPKPGDELRAKYAEWIYHEILRNGVGRDYKVIKEFLYGGAVGYSTLRTALQSRRIRGAYEHVVAKMDRLEKLGILRPRTMLEFIPPGGDNPTEYLLHYGGGERMHELKNGP